MDSTVTAEEVKRLKQQLEEAVTEFRQDMDSLRKKREVFEREWERQMDERMAQETLKKIYGTPGV